MRAALALVVLALLSSGCVTLGRMEPLGEHAAAAEPGASWYAPTLDPAARWRVRYEVTDAEGRLQACVVDAPDAFRGFRTDPFYAGLGSGGCVPLGEGNASSGALEADLPAGEARTLALDCLGGEACRATVRVEGKGVRPVDRGFLALGGVLAVILAFRVAADRLDRARIRDFVEARGGRVEDVSWRPFGRGWFGEKGERVYRVRFTDDAGQRQEAAFKTSLFSGVWTDRLGPR